MIGPRVLEHRHRIVAELMAGWPRQGQAQRLAPGFWNEAARQVGTAEGPDAIDGPLLSRWYPRHLKARGCSFDPAEPPVKQAD